MWHTNSVDINARIENCTRSLVRLYQLRSISGYPFRRTELIIPPYYNLFNFAWAFLLFWSVQNKNDKSRLDHTTDQKKEKKMCAFKGTKGDSSLQYTPQIQIFGPQCRLLLLILAIFELRFQPLVERFELHLNSIRTSIRTKMFHKSLIHSKKKI